MENGKGCKCVHHKVVPMCIALIGLVVFLGSINVVTAGFVGMIWPLLLVIIGVTKLIDCNCC